MSVLSAATLESRMLSFGPFRSDDCVAVEAAFEGVNDFFIARAAARDGRFPSTSAAAPGVMLAAGAGISPEAAASCAFGELVERVSAFMAAFDCPPTKCSALSLESRREDIILTSAYWDDSPLRSPGEQFGGAANSEEISWCEGRCLSTGRTAYVPSLAAYFQWHPPAGEKLFVRPDATGLSAHTSRDKALAHAICEILERDAAVLSWRVPGWPVTRINYKTQNSAVCALDLVARFYEIGGPGLPPVVLCLLAGRHGDRLTCGSACGNDFSKTVEHALHEALMLQWTMKDQVGDAPSVPKTSLDIVHRAYGHGLDVLNWYEQQVERTRIDRRSESIQDVQRLAARVEEVIGGSLVAVDVSSRMARGSGWNVFRAVLPAAMPRESDHRRACFDSRRLREALKFTGAPQERLNFSPHPFG